MALKKKKKVGERLPALEALEIAMSRGYIEIDTKGIVWRVRITRGVSHVLTLRVPRPMGRVRPETDGYMSFHFYLDGHQYQLLNHVAVYAFFYRRPLITEAVLHKNGVLLDNTPSNLVCVTRKELMRYLRPSPPAPATGIQRR